MYLSVVHEFDRDEFEELADLSQFEMTHDIEIIELAPGKEIEVDPKVFNLSAWRNSLLNSFSDAPSCTKCIGLGDKDLLKTGEARMHYYEIIDKGREQLGSVDFKVWKRFLVAGPNTYNEDYHHQESVDPVELAYYDMLMCVSWIADANQGEQDIVTVQRLKEAGLTTAAHILDSLDSNNGDPDHVDSRLSGNLLTKLDALLDDNLPMPLRQALAELLTEINNLPGQLILMREQFGELGDSMLSLSSSDEIVQIAEIAATNNHLHRSIQAHIVSKVSTEVWQSADHQALELVYDHGGHLCCSAHDMCQQPRIRQAALGMLSEVNECADRILFVGDEWLYLATIGDPKKRSVTELYKLVNNWLTLSVEATQDLPIETYLEIPVREGKIANIMQTIFELHRCMKDSNCEILFTTEEEIGNLSTENKQTVVVGPNHAGPCFFQGDSHYSIQVKFAGKAKNEIDFDKPAEDEGANRYFLDAFLGARTKYPGLGLWNSAYIPGAVLSEIEKIQLKDFPEDCKLTHFHRRVRKFGPPIFHSGYVFISKADGDEAVAEEEDPADQLLLT